MNHGFLQETIHVRDMKKSTHFQTTMMDFASVADRESKLPERLKRVKIILL